MGSSKNRFCNLLVSLPGGQKYFPECLCKNENIFKNILRIYSGDQDLLIQTKRHASKISCYSTVPRLNGNTIFFINITGTVSQKLTKTNPSLSIGTCPLKIIFIKGPVSKLHIKISALTTHLSLKVQDFSKVQGLACSVL